MKIQAKDLKVGMTVKSSYLTIDIERITEGTLKNGKTTMTVSGNGVHQYTGSKKTKSYPILEMTFKSLTKVDVI